MAFCSKWLNHNSFLKECGFEMHCDTDKSDVLMGCVYIILNIIHNQLQ